MIERMLIAGLIAMALLTALTSVNVARLFEIDFESASCSAHQAETCG
jgi:hypothetical protein